MIHYVIGDATDPQSNGHKIVAHVCNNVGGWGRGFVLSVSRKWKEPEKQYRQLAQAGGLTLGETQVVLVEPAIQDSSAIFVANMIAQVGYGKNNLNKHRTAEPDARPPIRYDALRSCLVHVADVAYMNTCTVHMPRIGCGLAGGEWSEVEPIINETMGNIDVYVYDLPVQV